MLCVFMLNSYCTFPCASLWLSGGWLLSSGQFFLFFNFASTLSDLSSNFFFSDVFNLNPFWAYSNMEIGTTCFFFLNTFSVIIKLRVLSNLSLGFCIIFINTEYFTILVPLMETVPPSMSNFFRQVIIKCCTEGDILLTCYLSGLWILQTDWLIVFTSCSLAVIFMSWRVSMILLSQPSFQSYVSAFPRF